MELKPFRIGDVEIESPVVLAAMAGYTDLAYRLICRDHGAPYCITEMLLDRSVLVGGKLRRRLIGLTEKDHPVAGQLIGNDPATMAEAARTLCEAGFDVVDLNFACPVRKTLRRRRGGYLMSQPDQAVEIVQAVVKAVDRPLTLKLRRSFGQTDRTADAFWRIAEGAFDAGAAAICVHARSVEAKYAGGADWGFLASLKQRLPDRTILGSGDVLTPTDALQLLERTGLDGVIVARGGLGNPWFFRQVQDLIAGRCPYVPSLSEQKQLLERHFQHACELYGPVRGPKAMRKFGIKYARIHPEPKRVRNAFVRVARPEDWQRVLETYYRVE